MTREEALQILDTIPTIGEQVDALEMAIEALEQEPKFIAKSDGTIEQIKNCNNCKYGYLSSICQKPNTEICGNSFSQWKPYKAESDDCISRAEAQKHIYQRLWESALNNVGYECKAEDVFMDIADNRLRTWVSEIPSIQPKPKTDVLEKIRAEIADLELGISRYHHYRPWIFRDEVLEIIDKYKAKSEDKE